MKMNHSEKFIVTFFILCVYLVEIGCNTPKQKAASKVTQTQPRNAVKVQKEIFTREDTFIVKTGKPEILAYAPSEAELDALPDSEKDDFNESYSDFMYHWHEYAEHPGKMRVGETGARFILIGDSTIDKHNLKENAFGVIFISRTGHFKIVGGQIDKREIELDSTSFAW